MQWFYFRNDVTLGLWMLSFGCLLSFLWRHVLAVGNRCTRVISYRITVLRRCFELMWNVSLGIMVCRFHPIESMFVYFAYFEEFVDWCMFKFVPKRIISWIIVVLLTLWVKIVECKCVYSLWDTRYTLSLTSALDRARDQRHASAALSPGMTRFSLHVRLGVPQVWSGEARKTCPHRDSIPGPSSP